MQVKVFEASDMTTALNLVKESLGPEALILSTRTIRKGGLGLLGKPTMEVTAAIESPGLGTAEKSKLRTQPSLSRVPAEQDLTYEDIWRKRRVIEPLEDEVMELKGQLAGLDVEALRREISGLKEMMRNYTPPETVGTMKVANEGSPLLRMISELTARGVEPSRAEQLVRRALQQPQGQKGKVRLNAFLARAIAGAVKCSGPFFEPGSKPRRIALLGPTGVGKTTTVAKLAADYLLNRGRSLALVTIDIYRIAAAEQLKVYGEIMNVPVDVASSPQEFRRVMRRHQDKELILIDTAGRSPRDREGIKALHEFIGPESGVENHLVLSTATRERENDAAVKRFTGMPLSSLIMTKLDECEALGSLLNTQLRHGTPLSYLTDGQRVPEDLLLARPEKIGQLILGTAKGN